MNFPPKMVLFDCDGVVVDSERVTNQVLRDDLAARGLDLPLDEIMHLFVGGVMAGVAVEAHKRGATIPDDWLETIYPKIYTALEHTVTTIPHIEAVLDALDAANIPYAIGSNGRLEKMDLTLGRTGLLARFKNRMYSGQDCAAPKPAPDVYLKAASDAGVDPADCVVIEDSANGARAGLAANMYTFGFTHDTNPDALAPYCDALFDDMAKLPKLLGLDL